RSSALSCATTRSRLSGGSAARAAASVDALDIGRAAAALPDPEGPHHRGVALVLLEERVRGALAGHRILLAPGAVVPDDLALAVAGLALRAGEGRDLLKRDATAVED